MFNSGLPAVAAYLDYLLSGVRAKRRERMARWLRRDVAAAAQAPWAVGADRAAREVEGSFPERPGLQVCRVRRLARQALRVRLAHPEAAQSASNA